MKKALQTFIVFIFFGQQGQSQFKFGLLTALAFTKALELVRNSNLTPKYR